MGRLIRKQQHIVGCEVTAQHLNIAHLVSGRRPRVEALYQVPNLGQSAAVLRTLAKDLNLHNAEWTWLLPQDDYQLMLIDVPEVPEEEVRDALRWRIKDLISFPLEEAAVDTLLLPADAFRGRSRMAFAVVTRKEKTEPLAAAFGAAGLKLRAIDVADTALRNLAAMTSQSPSVAVLSVGADESILNATYQQELCLNRAISLGYRDLNPAPTDHSVSEDLTLEDQSDVRLDSLALELQRSFDYFETQLGLGAISELQMVTQVPLDPEVYRFLADRFNLNTGPMQLADHLDFPTEVTEADIARSAVAIGGALQWIQEPA